MASHPFNLGTIAPKPYTMDETYSFVGLSEATPGLDCELGENLRGHEATEHQGSAAVGILWALGLEVAGALSGYGIWSLWKLL
jgi:hypothetical protein